MEAFLAYKSIDSFTDRCCEKAFLFKTDADVKKFFAEDNPTFIELFTEEEDRRLTNFQIHYSEADRISQIEFDSPFAGKVRIVKMLVGYMIQESQ